MESWKFSNKDLPFSKGYSLPFVILYNITHIHTHTHVHVHDKVHNVKPCDARAFEICRHFAKQNITIGCLLSRMETTHCNGKFPPWLHCCVGYRYLASINLRTEIHGFKNWSDFKSVAVKCFINEKLQSCSVDFAGRDWLNWSYVFYVVFNIRNQCQLLAKNFLYAWSEWSPAA